MKDLSSSLESLTQKSDQLISSYEGAQMKLVQMEEERARMKEKMEELNSELDALREENKVLKLASAIKGDEEKVTESKRRINQLVREIDKCLALLND